VLILGISYLRENIALKRIKINKEAFLPRFKAYDKIKK